MTVFATSSAFFPLVSLSIIRNLVLRSMIVRMKSFPFCMRSFSKCPNSSLFSTSGGLSFIDTLSGMFLTPAPIGRFRCFNLWRQCCIESLRCVCLLVWTCISTLRIPSRYRWLGNSPLSARETIGTFQVYRILTPSSYRWIYTDDGFALSSYRQTSALRHLRRISSSRVGISVKFLADSSLRYPDVTSYLGLCFFVLSHTINCVPLRLI